MSKPTHLLIRLDDIYPALVNAYGLSAGMGVLNAPKELEKRLLAVGDKVSIDGLDCLNKITIK